MTRPNALEQISLLRNFCGSEGYNDSDLTDCLRQAGYSVDRAAELLLTGQFCPKKRQETSSSASTTSHKRVRRLAPVDQKPNQRADKDQQLDGMASPMSSEKSLLLCERWISDAYCTPPRGSVGHLEDLVLIASGADTKIPQVRVKGDGLEAKLNRDVASFLAPLMDAGLVEISSKSLMRCDGLVSGSHVPISIRVSLYEHFFGVFESVKNEGSSSLFLQTVKNRKSSKRGVNIAEAAFNLLQWAQHGNLPRFGNLDTELEGEDGGEKEEKSMVDGSGSRIVDTKLDVQTIPEHRNPDGLKVALRTYQKQALHWMLQRESNDKEDELEESLRFLSSLSGNAKGSIKQHSHIIKGESIVCECGPVKVLKRFASGSPHHPLWQGRYLATQNLDGVRVFYVNELLESATLQAPPKPKLCSGGILADDMGLGKTVMLLSLIVQGRQNRQASARKTESTLIVVKMSLLPQWEEEIKSKTSLTVATYYGNVSTKLFLDTDVVLTTYGALQGDFKRTPSLLFERQWHRIILDEAHCIRNQSTLMSKVCCSLNARHRWCVTGTVIQNSLDDVYGMIKFLRHEPWCSRPFWKATISEASNDCSLSEDSTDQIAMNSVTALSRVRRVLRPIMLRRTKEMLSANGCPILSLPPKDLKVIHVEFSESERSFYNAVLARSRALFDGFLDSGRANKSYVQIFSLLQRLRQACDHVALTVRPRFRAGRDLATVTGPQDTTSEEEVDTTGSSFFQDLISKFFVSADHGLERSRDSNENYVLNVARAVESVVDGGSGSCLEEECSFCLEKPPIDDAVLTPCAHVFCRPCFVQYMDSKAIPLESPSSTAFETTGRFCVPCPNCNIPCVAKRLLRLSRAKSGEVVSGFLLGGKDATQPIRSHIKCTQEGNHIATANRILRGAVQGIESSKSSAILTEMNEVWKLDPGSKILVFSHYLGFLDLLETHLQSKRIPHFRLDGSLNLQQRICVLREFQLSKSVDGCGAVLLMSTTAGAEGLNLVAASSCFIADPWWNQSKEEQCKFAVWSLLNQVSHFSSGINRIHRIGQTASIVRVRKFVVSDSVEERIVELQSQKKFVADSVYGNTSELATSSSREARLDIEDFKRIFDSNKSL